MQEKILILGISVSVLSLLLILNTSSVGHASKSITIGPGISLNSNQGQHAIESITIGPGISLNSKSSGHASESIVIGGSGATANTKTQGDFNQAMRHWGTHTNTAAIQNTS
jgi:hypothetical protein